MTAPTDNPFRQWVRLEQPRLGTRVVFATDEFFGAKERLIEAGEPVFIPDRYDDHGKWMDGWESRRRRDPGNDHCVVRLGIPGVVRGVDIDTTHFTGNHPPAASIDACVSSDELPAAARWRALTDTIAIGPSSHHFVAIDGDDVVTHLRLNIFPDGGVARFRIYGEVRPDWAAIEGSRVDLFALENGGRALICNDEHFGSMHNLNLDGRGMNMGDGWETARRRTPGNDWALLVLGHRGVVDEVTIDTAHFKGNYPDRVMLQAATASAATPIELAAASVDWPVLLPEQKLGPDREHTFSVEVRDLGPVTHVRLSIFPDGGLSRLRLYGRPVDEG